MLNALQAKHSVHGARKQEERRSPDEGDDAALRLQPAHQLELALRQHLGLGVVKKTGSGTGCKIREQHQRLQPLEGEEEMRQERLRPASEKGERARTMTLRMPSCLATTSAVRWLSPVHIHT